MKEKWNERYLQDDYIYGIQPNKFLEQELPSLKPGKILFPGDGEGRNSIYAAKLGWEVHAFDYSETGKQKAQKLAKQNHVNINYSISDVAEYKTHLKFDCIGIFYLHLSAEIRKKFHNQIPDLLNQNGKIIMEVFDISNQKYNIMGPRLPELLYSIEMLKNDFQYLKIEQIKQQNTILSEGSYHKGKAEIIRLIASKK